MDEVLRMVMHRRGVTMEIARAMAVGDPEANKILDEIEGTF
jgi:hypothetical protein